MEKYIMVLRVKAVHAGKKQVISGEKQNCKPLSTRWTVLQGKSWMPGPLSNIQYNDQYW